MAGEIQVSFRTGLTLYAIIRSRTAQAWNTAGAAFETYQTANYTDYDIALTEQGTASAFYAGSFPSAVPAGVYSVVAKQQMGGTPAETDPTVGVETYHWNGAATLPLSDLATSGMLGQFGPIRLARGTMIQNFPLYFKLSSDHISPLVSGVVSGQISRDNGAFGALQSGAFTEIGLGHFNLQALTSGDLLANTVRLHFSAVGMSGGAADPLAIGIILQRTSGQ